MAIALSIPLLLATSAFAHLGDNKFHRRAPTSSAAPPAQTTAAPAQTAPPAGNSPLPLTDYKYPFSDIPYQVYPFAVGRGPQSGYNICNSTTEGPTSQCQTAFVNSIDDFCLWGSPTANGQIGNVEAAVVAYCSKPGHGTRVFPAGTLKGVTFMRTPGYIQVTGLFDQRGINLDPADYGGELDPHGADLAGNPLGGLVYSNSLPTNKGQLTQGDNWSNFVGSGQFCFKVCDNSITSPNYCENRFDLIGCSYNMPSNAYNQPGVFVDCQGDNQLPPGQYIENGQTVTWKQPGDVLPPGYTLPYQPSIPASSMCTTYTSSSLYAAETGLLPGASSSASSSAATSGAASSGASGSTPSSSAASPTGSSSGASGLKAAGFAVAGAAAAVLALLD